MIRSTNDFEARKILLGNLATKHYRQPKVAIPLARMYAISHDSSYEDLQMARLYMKPFWRSDDSENDYTIGVLLFRLERHNEGIHRLKKAFEAKKSERGGNPEYGMLFALADAYGYLGEYDKARDVLLQVEAMRDIYNLPYAYYQAALRFEEMGHCDTALKFYQKVALVLHSLEEDNWVFPEVILNDLEELLPHVATLWMALECRTNNVKVR